MHGDVYRGFQLVVVGHLRSFLFLLSELGRHLLDGAVLGLGDHEPDVQDEEDLDHHEDDEHVRSDRQLKQIIIFCLQND
jgi:hypothetical protein